MSTPSRELSLCAWVWSPPAKNVGAPLCPKLVNGAPFGPDVVALADADAAESPPSRASGTATEAAGGDVSIGSRRRTGSTVSHPMRFRYVSWYTGAGIRSPVSTSVYSKTSFWLRAAFAPVILSRSFSACFHSWFILSRNLDSCTTVFFLYTESDENCGSVFDIGPR